MPTFPLPPKITTHRNQCGIPDFNDNFSIIWVGGQFSHGFCHFITWLLSTCVLNLNSSNAKPKCALFTESLSASTHLKKNHHQILHAHFLHIGIALAGDCLKTNFFRARPIVCWRGLSSLKFEQKLNLSLSSGSQITNPISMYWYHLDVSVNYQTSLRFFEGCSPFQSKLQNRTDASSHHSLLHTAQLPYGHRFTRPQPCSCWCWSSPPPHCICSLIYDPLNWDTCTESVEKVVIDVQIGAFYWEK